MNINQLESEHEHFSYFVRQTLICFIYNPDKKCWDDFQTSARNTIPPLPCCHIAVCMYSPNDFSTYQHSLTFGDWL